MKKAIIGSTAAAFLALTLLCFNGRAEPSVTPDGIYEDIPLVQEGYSYYIRPNSFEDGYVAMLPLSAVLYEYADISFDEGQGCVFVTCGTLDVAFTVGETVYEINGELAELDAPPEVIDGLVYVPSTFFERTFGFWVTSEGEGFMDLFMPSFIIDNI